MRAAVLHETGQSLVVEDVRKPKIGPQEALVQTRACGICRTDIHILDGLAYIPELPHVPGHEPSGVVVEVGERVDDLEVGQRVVPHLFHTCGNCYFCRVGEDALCTNLQGIIGVTLPGGFAEYFAAPAKNLFVLPDNVPFETGGLVSCAVITAVHAFRRARLSSNDSAVIVGAGGIGQLLIQILKSAGIRVIATGRSEQTLETARKLGADLALRTTSPDTVKKVKEFAGDQGAQCVFDCVGLAKTMKDSAEYVMSRGQIIVIGEEAEFPEVDTIQIAQRELEIIGSRNGSRQDTVESLSMMAAGIIDPVVSRTFPLQEINQAMEFVRSGQAHGRVVVKIEQ